MTAYVVNDGNILLVVILSNNLKITTLRIAPLITSLSYNYCNQSITFELSRITATPHWGVEKNKLVCSTVHVHDLLHQLDGRNIASFNFTSFQPIYNP
jgi:hypothetical protein